MRERKIEQKEERKISDYEKESELGKVLCFKQSMTINSYKEALLNTS